MPDHPVIPNIFANGPGNTADADLINANYEYLRAWLDSRFGGATSAQLWVANASGVATPRTPSGPIAISNTGVFSIGANAIGPTQMADNAVGEEEVTTALAQKLGITEASTTRRDNATVATSENTTSIAFADLATPGPSITLDVPANGLVTLFCKADVKVNGSGDAFVDIFEDGASLSGGGGFIDLSGISGPFETWYSNGTPTGTNLRSGGRFTVLQVAAGSHTYKMTYKKGGGATSADFQNRRIFGVAVGF